MLFIWIPKCAGTSIVNIYQLNKQIIPLKNNNLREYCFDNNSNVTFGHVDINILLKNNILSLDFYNKSFKFCIVRNPYDRAVSLFFYRHLDKKYTFKQWVEYLYKNKHNIPKNSDTNTTIYKDIHNQWNSMCSWIPDDINKIYYFENLNTITDDINKEIGIKENTLLCHINATSHKKYIEYYDIDTQDMIYEIYKEDFIRFNYSKNL